MHRCRRVDNPLAQPWSAFDQGQLLNIAAQSMVTGMLFNYVPKVARKLHRTVQTRAARATVQRDIEAYCAARENGGAGEPICERAKPPR